MHITDPAERDAVIAGLHELADFLAGHPEVPLPKVRIHAVDDDQALNAWICGLDSLDIEPGIVDSYRVVVRTFADGLRVPLSVRTDQVGEVREVPSTAVELVPFTPDEIRERAAKGVAA